MSKKNTLFSYFKKTPQKPSDQKSNTEKKVLTPKSAGLQASNNKDNAIQKEVNAYKSGDIVWAKLEGYPWWPSLVCNDPSTNTCCKKGKVCNVHVQFFDEPPTHAWIKEKFVKAYTGSDSKECLRGGTYFSADPKRRKASEQADKAMQLSVDERLKLVVSHKEESESEEEDMEFDNDIFDKEEETDDDRDKSKENCETKSPKKSQKKSGRSTKQPKTKRRRIVESHNSSGSEESGDEFKPGKHAETSDDDSSGVDEDDISEAESDLEPDSPVKKPQKRKRPSTAPTTPKATSTAPTTPKANESLKDFFSTPNTSATSIRTPTVSVKTKSKLASFSAPETTEEAHTNFTHLQFDFLKPENIRDAKKNTPQDPEYDPRSIYITESFMAKQTPAMRQWWEIKQHNFDTVLFFKMGKFYELFHMDAMVAVNELGLIFMKGDHAHCGFPEIGFSRYADILIQKGYRIARIEQTETPEMMQERVKKLSRSTKFDKVVKREICKKTSKGTKVYSFIDGNIAEAKNEYLLAICEQQSQEAGNQGSAYGVCFVDTSIGKFHLGQFTDDRYSSRLRTLISHYLPAQVLYEKGRISEKTQNILKTNLSLALKEALHSGSEFWESGKTLKFLSEGDYFVDETTKELNIPETLKSFISENDNLQRTAADGKELAIRALGALTWYLCDCMLDQELLSLSSFEEYIPIDNDSHSIKTDQEDSFARQHMILDGVTLANLEILQNTNTGTLEGTLLERLDQCCTPFGKRLLKQWLCSPLCSVTGINDRLNAVEDLIERQDLTSEVMEYMKKLPDLERLLSKIHTLGSATRSKNHPESRAIYFEDNKYSKRKIEDFLSALAGFKEAVKLRSKIGSSSDGFKSTLLKQAVTLEDDSGNFPDLKDELEFFQQAFDHDKAQKAGVIIPSKGVDEEYDDSMNDIDTCQQKLDEYLQTQKKELGCRNLAYWGTAKNRYQMEVPEALRNIPHHYELMSSKKGTKRYRTKEIENLLAQLVDAEERRDAALRDIMRRIFYQFDKSYQKWLSCVHCLSVLDVLICMAQYSRCGDGVMCRPEIESATQPFIEVREATHPCVTRTFSGGDFIPNDTVIGIKDENDMDTDDDYNACSNVVLVTGPNMGGKSTLMRQLGLVVIMAQMGCYVPAEKCRLTPVDRVFTRLGASDNIMGGESTFMVELSETSAILSHATKHSLVLMDELGRGTATYDGTAIAMAVVKNISEKINCRCLFSTHYHSLVDSFSHDPNVRLGHMACMVENEDADDPSQETITFLYKFVKGACPKSYGFNAARLAHLPEQVIQVAIQKAKQFEHVTDQLKHFRQFHQIQGKDELLQLQKLITVA